VAGDAEHHAVVQLGWSAISVPADMVGFELVVLQVRFTAFAFEACGDQKLPDLARGKGSPLVPPPHCRHANILAQVRILPQASLPPDPQGYTPMIKG